MFVLDDAREKFESKEAPQEESVPEGFEDLDNPLADMPFFGAEASRRRREMQRMLRGGGVTNH